MFSAFNPSKWSSGQPTLRRPGSSWGFGALLKGLTSVVDTSCQSRDSNPQPWVTSGFKSNTLSIRPRLPVKLYLLIFRSLTGGSLDVQSLVYREKTSEERTQP